jgi:hypothetical protein
MGMYYPSTRRRLVLVRVLAGRFAAAEVAVCVLDLGTLDNRRLGSARRSRLCDLTEATMNSRQARKIIRRLSVYEYWDLVDYAESNQPLPWCDRGDNRATLRKAYYVDIRRARRENTWIAATSANAR